MKAKQLLTKMMEFLRPNAQDIASIDDTEYSRRFGNFYHSEIHGNQIDDTQQLSEDEYDLRFSKFYPEPEDDDIDNPWECGVYISGTEARIYGGYSTSDRQSF